MFNIVYLAVTSDPSDKNSYTYMGPIFPDIAWSKSGGKIIIISISTSPSSTALLINDSGSLSHLIWGDSSISKSI
jgi:hypothetical protein